MAKRRCPGCGAPYDGKRCRSCYYTAFDAEEVPRLHGEMRRPSTPSLQMPQRKYPSPKYRTPGKRKAVAVILVFLALTFLPGLLGVLLAVTEEVISEISYSVAEPEPLDIPEDGLVLYDEDGIRVTLGWNGGAITGDIPVYLENDSDRDVCACTNGVAVNGLMTQMTDDVFFYVDARSGTMAMSQLWIDTEQLARRGIHEVCQIDMVVEVIDNEDYTLLNDPKIFSFGPGGTILSPDIIGDVLLKNEELLLTFQGVEADEYGSLYLRFFAKNRTGKLLDLSSTELMINDRSSGQYLWQRFFPDTAAVISVELHRAQELDIRQTRDIQTVSFQLEGALDNDWTNTFTTSAIVVNP